MAGDGLASGLANSWLNTLQGTAYSQTTSYVQLHTGDPGAAGTSNISAGSSARVLATLAGAAGGAIALSSMASSWTNGGTSETITNITLWTLSAGGVFKLTITLTVAKAWASADTLSLNSLGVSLTPIAS